MIDRVLIVWCFFCQGAVSTLSAKFETEKMLAKKAYDQAKALKAKEVEGKAKG